MSRDVNEPPYKGECLCGSIKYEVDEIEAQMGHCHCTMCRKFSGAAFTTYEIVHATTYPTIVNGTILVRIVINLVFCYCRLTLRISGLQSA